MHLLSQFRQSLGFLTFFLYRLLRIGDLLKVFENAFCGKALLQSKRAALAAYSLFHSFGPDSYRAVALRCRNLI